MNSAVSAQFTNLSIPWFMAFAGIIPVKGRTAIYCQWEKGPGAVASVNCETGGLVNWAVTVLFTNPAAGRLPDATAPRGRFPIDGIWPFFPSQE